MTTDVDDFLAHYGVVGMKWGKRSGSSGGSSSGNTKEPKKPMSPETKAKLKKIGLTAGSVALVGGVMYGMHLLETHGKTPVSQLPSFSSLIPKDFGKINEKAYAAPARATKMAKAASTAVSKSSNTKLSSYKNLADEYRKNPQAGEWLRQASPAAFKKIMDL